MQVRSALFGGVNVNSESNSLKEELQSNILPYSSININSEKFLANAINSTQSDLLNFAPKIYEMLAKENNSFIISQDIAKSSLANVLIQTIMGFQFFYEIIISNGEYSSFLNFLSQGLKNCKYLKKITFNNISFTKLASNDLIFQQKDINASFDSISFINGCNFSTNQFLVFLKDISHYQGNIESIIIKNCIF